MTVEILEISRISTIKGFLWLFDDDGTCFSSEIDDMVYLHFTGDIVSESESRVRCGSDGKSGVVRDTCLWPEGEAESVLEIEKCHRAILELFSDNSCSRKTEAITIESYRFLEIAYGKSDNGNFCFHRIETK